MEINLSNTVVTIIYGIDDKTTEVYDFNSRIEALIFYNALLQMLDNNIMLSISVDRAMGYVEDYRNNPNLKGLC